MTSAGAERGEVLGMMRCGREHLQLLLVWRQLSELTRKGSPGWLERLLRSIHRKYNE